MGRAVDFHRPVLRTVAGLGAARRRHLRDVVLAVPDRQFRLGAGVVGSALAVRRRDRAGRRMAVADGLASDTTLSRQIRHTLWGKIKSSLSGRGAIKAAMLARLPAQILSARLSATC